MYLFPLMIWGVNHFLNRYVDWTSIELNKLSTKTYILQNIFISLMFYRLFHTPYSLMYVTGPYSNAPYVWNLCDIVNTFYFTIILAGLMALNKYYYLSKGFIVNNIIYYITMVFVGVPSFLIRLAYGLLFFDSYDKLMDVLSLYTNTVYAIYILTTIVFWLYIKYKKRPIENQS